MKTLTLLFLSTSCIVAATPGTLERRASGPAGGKSLVLVAGVTTGQDTVILKSGRMITGTIVVSTPGEGVKIRTQDGAIHTYKSSAVSKIKLSQHIADVPAKIVPPGLSHRKDSLGSRPRYENSFQGSLSLGGTFNSSEMYLGLGIRCDYRTSPGFFIGIGAANHIVGSNTFGAGYLGAEFVYEVKRSNVSFQPYVSGGLLYFSQRTAAYVAPALAIAIWVTPKIGVAGDLKYAYAPSYSAGMGFFYLGVMLKF